MKESGMSMMGYGDGMMGDGMMGWMVLWTVLGLILLIAIATGVAMMVARINRRSAAAPTGVPRGQHEAGEVLRKRFASGEIDDDDFRRRLAVLEGR